MKTQLVILSIFNIFFIYSEVLQIKPDNINAIATLGVAYKRMGKKDEALKYFQQALKLSPNDADVLNNIGSILYEQEQYDKSAEQFLKALQVKPEDVEVLSNLGNSLTKAKNFQHAWVAFDEALKISPANTTIIENYLLCLLEGKYFDKFDEMLAKIKFLTADVKARLLTIADEYKTVLGVKAKKYGKKQLSVLNASKKGTHSFLQKIRGEKMADSPSKAKISIEKKDLQPVEEVQES